MKTVSVAFKAHLAQQYQTRAFCWLVVRTDGVILAITEHDRDIPFNLETAMTAVGLTPGPGIAGTGLQVYSAESGYRGTDIATASGLNVDTGEAQGMLVSPSITELDMLAGIWDNAAITVFQVNWADLTMGAMIERSGTIGEITTDRGFFKAEWRGLMQAYQQNIGYLDSPFCNAEFGDARCGKNIVPLTFSGAITGLNTDGVTFYDTSRAEPGPTGGIAITNITNANLGHVTMASAGTFQDGDPVVISGVSGMIQVNNLTIIRNKSGAGWDLGIDTTDTSTYFPYLGGGLVTPLGGTASFFDAGIVRFLSGLNAGREEIVKQYVPGQVTLQLPMPRARTVGDTYEIVKGCIKNLSACRDTHNNLVNMRAMPFFPGNDAIIQVSRRQ